MSKELLSEIPTYQASVQTAFKPDWIDEPWNFLRQARLELAEAIEHLGRTKNTSWWKKTEANIPQAALELVDALVFISLNLIREGKRVGLHNDKYRYAGIVLSKAFQKAESLTEDLGHLERMGRAIHYIDLALQATSDNTVAKTLAYMATALGYLGVTTDSFVNLFAGKGALNEFRQHNGYKQGTYVKMWEEGKEDNDFLFAICSELDAPKDASLTELNSLVYSALAEKYEALGHKDNTVTQKYN